jgi:hypothetical protein
MLVHVVNITLVMVRNAKLRFVLYFQAYHRDGRPYAGSDWALARAILTGETTVEEDTIIERGDGTRGVLRQNAMPVKNAQGITIAAVVCGEDVTDKLKAQVCVCVFVWVWSVVLNIERIAHRLISGVGGCDSGIHCHVGWRCRKSERVCWEQKRLCAQRHNSWQMYVLVVQVIFM